MSAVMTRMIAHRRVRGRVQLPVPEPGPAAAVAFDTWHSLDTTD